MAANDQSERNRLRARIVVVAHEEADSTVSVAPPNGYFEYPEGPTQPDDTSPVLSWIATGHTRIVFPRAMSLQEEQVWCQCTGNASGDVVNIEYSGATLPSWTTLDIFTADATGTAADLGYMLNIETVRTIGSSG
jgi:hypothetical protein